ncbi:VWA domain-containing protein [Fulvivirgaceae bacterium PWU4]|uniref:VWA domain-containing protein n=1 Tax=Chryseosolibacter histidini TaxID=2782349 RepID=A0AAP2GKL0_9BACT|nr:VWA domain-containing protein [Chryseosolibacter histidini]MBT1699426.1 VWA domain-containing protein [Chryseosolibacter histidini]
MRTPISVLLCFWSIPVLAQITPAQQKSLNACVDYANQTADGVTAVIRSIIDYYPSLERKNFGAPRYVCPSPADVYYYNNAVSQCKTLGNVAASLSSALENLRGAEQKIDQQCKALDTYHKLEDYKQDNFARARSLIAELQTLTADYQKKLRAFQLVLETSYKKLGGGTADKNYQQSDARMLAVIGMERQLIDTWSFNLEEKVHTGWPVDKLTESIPETDRQLSALKGLNTTLKYPASSMWSAFQEALSSILEIKRNALDGYNYEAKKSDKHSNDVYLELINYFNGTLVSDYNTFIQFSERDNYRGLKTIKYVPLFEIRSQSKAVSVDVKPFKDRPYTPLKVAVQKTAIGKPVFESLLAYVEFINECWRETGYLQSVIGNFSSTAASFKNLESYGRRAPMHFDYGDYKVPLSYYQKAVSGGNVVPAPYGKALNDQAEVLLNVLKEMDDLCAVLETEVKERKYEQDRLARVYTILERQAELFRIWDEKKELLYNDLRAVYDSYPVTNTASAWQISGKALRTLTDLNREALFKAKAYYNGDSTVTVPTEEIDKTVREVIANEYENMKGIQKIGRNNGLCPYTPYEDLPETARRLSEDFKKLKPAGTSSGYSHPYHSMVYLYNEIVDDYNKFCELSTSVYHLKTIKQPELFALHQASSKAKATQNKTNEPVRPGSGNVQNNATAKDKPTAVPGAKTTVVHDTVYIEKRDTVYLTGSTDDLRSMEGYATNNMILLLDVSGSMNQPGKLPLLKQSMLDMLSMMRQEDHISIIAFSGKPRILLKSTSFKEEDKIRKAVNDLSSSGKTDGNAALKLAYKVADENYIRGGNNRIILATDGEFEIGDEIRQLIGNFTKQDIFLSVFNFGKGAGTSKTLEAIATLGKGNYEPVSAENIRLKLIREAKARRK